MWTFNAGNLTVLVSEGTEQTSVAKQYNASVSAEIRLQNEEEIRQLQFLLKQARRKFKERRRYRKERARV